MVPTNHYFRARLQVVDARLKQLEGYRTERVRTAALEQLREEREILNLILLNRRVEAARQVVDLRRWRTANGAVALTAPERPGKAARAG
jgi:hypothetical protein